MTKITLNYNLDLEPQSEWLFISSVAEIKSNFPFIQELGDFYCKGEYFTQRKNLESYYIAYTKSGSGVLEYNNTTYEIEPFQLLWIDCMQYQRYFTNPDKGKWNQIWVHFYGNSCKKYYNLFLKRNNDSNVVTMPANNSITEKIKSLLKIYENGNNLNTDTFAISILTNIMTQCIMATSSVENKTPYPDYIRDAISFIQEDYSEQISLEMLADQFSINKFHFHRMFKKYLGTTPNEYLITIRINKAKELLRATNLQINQIAPRVGIENVSHFINTFKKSEGMTPLEFRNQWLWK
ncbi:MAG: helix-turn-helix transcriptional regulator [Clostridiaceae bacterium]|nr:helix-turn-helix transcriptional regulator [Clostridiaceae bacterium]